MVRMKNPIKAALLASLCLVSQASLAGYDDDMNNPNIKRPLSEFFPQNFQDATHVNSQSYLEAVKQTFLKTNAEQIGRIWTTYKLNQCSNFFSRLVTIAFLNGNMAHSALQQIKSSDMTFSQNAKKSLPWETYWGFRDILTYRKEFYKIDRIFVNTEIEENFNVNYNIRRHDWIDMRNIQCTHENAIAFTDPIDQFVNLTCQGEKCGELQAYLRRVTPKIFDKKIPEHEETELSVSIDPETKPSSEKGDLSINVYLFSRKVTSDLKNTEIILTQIPPIYGKGKIISSKHL